LVVAVPPLSVADAPDPGGVKVTVTPGTTLPLASLTTTRSGEAKAVPTVLDCGLPLTTAIEAGAPAVFVSEKEAGAPTPAAVAFTV
jgi:hypothetical protein